MVTNQKIDDSSPNSFDWGEAVKVSANAIASKYGFDVGSVCGFRNVTTDEEAKELGVPLGSSILLVEDGFGVAREIPAKYVEKL